MEESDIKAPLYYVLGRKADIEQVAKILTITPCYYGIAHCDTDKVLLQPFISEVVYASDSELCHVMAEHVARATGRAVLIAGDGGEVKAVYSTGEEETLCLSNLT